MSGILEVAEAAMHARLVPKGNPKQDVLGTVTLAYQDRVLPTPQLTFVYSLSHQQAHPRSASCGLTKVSLLIPFLGLFV